MIYLVTGTYYAWDDVYEDDYLVTTSMLYEGEFKEVIADARNVLDDILFIEILDENSSVVEDKYIATVEGEKNEKI